MTFSSGDAHPFPIYNARFRVTFPILDADGDLVTAAATLDSEASQNSGTFADCTNEATELATGSGMYALDLIATELDTKVTAIIVKTATAGAKTTPIVLYPRRLGQVKTGTAQAGAATTITLSSDSVILDDYYVGCYVNITNDSPANVLGQARLITDYVGSTRVATVEAAWGTNPSVASTFEILATDTWIQRLADVNAFGGIASTQAAGRPEVNTTHAAGTAWASGAITAASIAAAAITAAKFGAGAIDAAAVAGGAIDADALDTTAVTEIVDAIWNAITHNYVVSGSFGERLHPLRYGIAQAGAAGTVTLDSGASTLDDYYNGQTVMLTAGTGSRQTRVISDYVGATRVASITPNWITAPDATSKFVVLPEGPVSLATLIAQQVADEVLKRSVAGVEATAAEWSLATLILAVLESVISGTTWTIKRTDGTTTHFTKTVATSASAEHITSVS